MLSFKSFIDEDFKTTASKFVASGTDTTEVDNYINRFKILNKNQRLSGEQKNIDFWGKKPFAEFKDFVISIEAVKTKSASEKDTGTFLTIPDSNWNIIIPTDKSASCFHGSGTDWCTSKVSQEHFEEYFYDKNIILVYLINKETKKEKYAMALNKDKEGIHEFFNLKDEKITKQQLSKKTSLDINKLIKQVLELNLEIETQRKASKKLNLAYTLKDLTHPDKEIEQRIINSGNAEYAYDYAYRILKGPFKAAEAVIAKNVDYAYDYALNVLEGPFKAGEALIVKDAGSAFGYALYVLKGPFPTGEKAIAKDPYFAYAYALEVLKGPFKAGEAVIAKDWMWRRPYAVNVLKGPFILNGKTIVK